MPRTGRRAPPLTIADAQEQPIELLQLRPGEPGLSERLLRTAEPCCRRGLGAKLRGWLGPRNA